LNCGADGAVSILGLVPAGQVMEPPAGRGETDPVMVHVTVCRPHLKSVRAWLRTRMLPEDEPWTMGTEFLLREWGQVIEPLAMPVYGMASVRAAG
jgi:hypothetical protein